jgi:hypothetical protein
MRVKLLNCCTEQILIVPKVCEGWTGSDIELLRNYASIFLMQDYFMTTYQKRSANVAKLTEARNYNVNARIPAFE